MEMKILNEKKIVSINGPVVKAKGTADFAMHDMVYVGEKRILGEVIKLENDIATIQVYEDTTGLKIYEPVETTGNQVSLTLGPGSIGNIFDGIQRPLESLRNISGDFINSRRKYTKYKYRKKMEIYALYRKRGRGCRKLNYRRS